MLTMRAPPEASTAPATTRRPFPSAPRCGSRKSFEERIGRRMQNSAAISSGSPSRPGPSSATANRGVRVERLDAHAVPVSSALSSISLRTSRRRYTPDASLLAGPSGDRNRAQSSRSDIFKIGSFSAAPKLVLERRPFDRVFEKASI